MASHKENTVWREIIPVRHPLYVETAPDGLRTICKFITWEQFMSIPAGVGGRVGVIPWYMANVTSQHGVKEPRAMVRLCVSNYLYLSDFGGGFKKHMDPYSGLEKELKEEVPLWKNYLMEELPQKTNLFIVFEQYNIDPHKHQPIPLMILLFIRISVDKLNEFGFKPTKEIRAVFDQTIEQFHHRVDTAPLTGNLGIRMYHHVRKHPESHRYLDAYFRSKKLSHTEFNEADLINEKVDVMLYNDISTLPFSSLIRNNSTFSNHTEHAWRKRIGYAERKLSQRTHPLSVSPVPQGDEVVASRGNRNNRQRWHVNRRQNAREENRKENNNGFTMVSRSRGKYKNKKNNTRKR